MKNEIQLTSIRKISFGYTFLLFMLLFFFISNNEVIAQTTIIPDDYSVTYKETPYILEMAETVTTISRAISGKVYAADGTLMTGVEVKQVKSNTSFVTKQNGSFVFLVDESVKQIEISAPGFETKLITLTNEDYYKITLQQAKQICPTRSEIMRKIELLKTID